MSVDRLTRVNELLKREVGSALFQVVHEEEMDLSAITITAVEATPSLRSAIVKVSIRDHQNERKQILSALRHYRGRLQELINKNLTLKYTPRLSFELDTSVEKGDHILQVLSQLEATTNDPEDSTPKETTS